MQQWEYKYISANGKQIEKLLNELGKEGWEAVNVTTDTMHVVCLLKRPKV